MDFGKSLGLSLAFDFALPLIAGIVKASAGSRGDAIADVINTSSGIIKDSVRAKLDGTSFQEAAPQILTNHLPQFIDSLTHIADNHENESHEKKLFLGTDHLLQALNK